MSLIQKPLAYAIFLSSFCHIAAAANPPTTENQSINYPVEEVIVTADFRDVALQNAPMSATVLSEDIILERNAQHLEELLALTPNVNFSSGSSRARYIQIRGIGERSQFASPVNPSVGLIIDDVDFTGIGTAGTLYDMRQVEVLRGPQGTRYGANALAGIIAMQSNQPTNAVEGHVDAGIGNYNTKTLGTAVGGPVTDNLLYRVAIQKNTSNGYIENDFLDSKDTNNFDELTARAKLRWLASDTFTLDTNFMFIDIDNGYDAFSLDNNRSTLSDQPGHDRQETYALSMKADWQLSSKVSTQIIGSISDTDTEYGYDEDWTYAGICAALSCDAPAADYVSFDNYKRERQNSSLEARFLSGADGRLFNDSTDWLTGIYFNSQTEDLERQYTFLGADFLSEYDTFNTAMFFETSTTLTDKLTMTMGVRVEQWQADYQDSNGLDLDTDETLYGGKFVLDYQYSNDSLVYGSIARGFKAGGVNNDGKLTGNQLYFDTEYQWAYEAGIKTLFMDGDLQLRTAIFYVAREDQQVKNSTAVPKSPGPGTDFIDVIDNAATGHNYGLEIESFWQVTDELSLTTSVGFLETEFDEYIRVNGDDLSGREQAHAPNYQYAISLRYQITNDLYGQVSGEGKEAFFLSDSHSAKSNRYNLINAQFGYEIGNWTASFWGKNLTDEDYAVRGFSGFDADPRTGKNSNTYTQLGAPRTYGVSTRYSF